MSECILVFITSDSNILKTQYLNTKPQNPLQPGILQKNYLFTCLPLVNYGAHCWSAHDPWIHITLFIWTIFHVNQPQIWRIASNRKQGFWIIVQTKNKKPFHGLEVKYPHTKTDHQCVCWVLSVYISLSQK